MGFTKVTSQSFATPAIVAPSADQRKHNVIAGRVDTLAKKNSFNNDFKLQCAAGALCGAMIIPTLLFLGYVSAHTLWSVNNEPIPPCDESCRNRRVVLLVAEVAFTLMGAVFAPFAAYGQRQFTKLN